MEVERVVVAVVSERVVLIMMIVVQNFLAVMPMMRTPWLTPCALALQQGSAGAVLAGCPSCHVCLCHPRESGSQWVRIGCRGGCFALLDSLRESACRKVCMFDSDASVKGAIEVRGRA